MRFPRKCKPWLVTADRARENYARGYQLQHAKLSAIKPTDDGAGYRGELVATDGKALVVIPVEIQSSEGAPISSEGLIDVETMKRAAKLAKSVPMAEIAAGETLGTNDGATGPRPGGDFPAYAQLFPDWLASKPLRASIDLNPQLLARLADAMGSKDRVRLTFELDEVADFKERLLTGSTLLLYKDKHMLVTLPSEDEGKAPCGAMMPLRRGPA